MNIVFIVTTDSVNVDKPPRATVFTSWKETCAHIFRWFPEIEALDVFDDVIKGEIILQVIYDFFKENKIVLII